MQSISWNSSSEPLSSWTSHELSSVLLAPGTRSKFINVNEVFLKRSHSSGTASCLENPSQTLLIVALTRRYMEGTVTRLVYVESNSTVKFSNLLARGNVTLRTIFIEFIDVQVFESRYMHDVIILDGADKHGSRPTLDQNERFNFVFAIFPFER